ncbi:MAG: hypothetical protein WBF88_12200 [Pusillimonas sp.]
MIEDNGILAGVPGQYIGEALSQLPECQADSENTEVVIEAGHLGMVRLFAQPRKAAHGKHSHWFWCAYRAQVI